MTVMEFIIATNNKKKLRELRAILDEFGIAAKSLAEAGVVSDADETGTTFEENARIKAQAAMERSGLPAIADDSGLVVDALGGAPGVYSARYGGETCQNDTERYELLLKNMADVPDTARQARFVSAVCLTFPDGREIMTRGEVEGVILRAPRGEGGFGYDPIFFLPERDASMAELSAEEKNEISHRARALSALREKLKNMIG